MSMETEPIRFCHGLRIPAIDSHAGFRLQLIELKTRSGSVPLRLPPEGKTKHVSWGLLCTSHQTTVYFFHHRSDHVIIIISF